MYVCMYEWTLCNFCFYIENNKCNMGIECRNFKCYSRWCLSLLLCFRNLMALLLNAEPYSL